MVRIRLDFHTVGSQCTILPLADQFVEKWICQCIQSHAWIYTDSFVLRPISVLVDMFRRTTALETSYRHVYTKICIACNI